MSLPNIPASAEVVSFDLWMTLIRHDGRAFKNARNGLLGAEFAPHMEPAAFDQLVRAQDRQADKIAETRGTDVQFAERITMVAHAAGAPRPSRAKLATLYEQQTQLFAEHPPVLLDPRTPQLLAALSMKHRLAVVSNTGFVRGVEMRQALERLNILDAFSYLIFSDEVGYAKPHPRIFGALLDKADVPAERVTHIGDNLHADIEGARQLGMGALHLAAGMTIGDIIV